MQTILAWHVTCTEDEDANLQRGCDFFVELNKNVTSAAVVSANPSWLQSAKGALQTLETKLVEVGKTWASQTWRFEGPEEIVGLLGQCKYIPAPLKPILNLAQNKSVIEGLVPINFKMENLEKELPQMVKPVKRFMTLSSLDSETMAEFLSPEIVQQVDAFKKSVSENILRLLQHASEAQNKVLPYINKYRQGPGHAVLSSCDKPSLALPSYKSIVHTVMPGMMPTSKFK